MADCNSIETLLNQLVNEVNSLKAKNPTDFLGFILGLIDELRRLITDSINSLKGLIESTRDSLLKSIDNAVNAVKDLLLAAIAALSGRLNTEITDRQRGDNALESKLSALETRIAQNERKVEVIEKDVEKLTGVVFGIAGTLAVLGSRVGSLEAKVSQLEGDAVGSIQAVKEAAIAAIDFTKGGAIAAIGTTTTAGVAALGATSAAAVAGLGTVTGAATAAITGLTASQLAIFQAQVALASQGLTAAIAAAEAAIATGSATATAAITGTATTANTAIATQTATATASLTTLEAAALGAIGGAVTTALAMARPQIVTVPQPYPVETIRVERITDTQIVLQTVPQIQIQTVPQPYPVETIRVERITETQIVPLTETQIQIQTVPQPYPVSQIVPYPVPQPYPVTQPQPYPVPYPVSQIVPYEIPVTNTVYIDRPTTTLVPVPTPYPITNTVTNTITNTVNNTEIREVEKQVVVTQTQTEVREVEKQVVVVQEKMPDCEELRDCLDAVCNFSINISKLFKEGYFIPIRMGVNAPQDDRCAKLLAPAISGVNRIFGALADAIAAYFGMFPDPDKPTIERINITIETSELINSAIQNLNAVPLGVDSAVPAMEALAQNVMDMLLEKDSEGLLVVPEWWTLRPEHRRPQLVVVYREDDTDSRWSLVIPHYKGGKTPKPKLPSYQKGNIRGVLRLSDNSHIVVYCRTLVEAKRVIRALKRLVSKPVMENAAESYGETSAPFKQCTVKPVLAKYFPDGMKDKKPEWTIPL